MNFIYGKEPLTELQQSYLDIWKESLKSSSVDTYFNSMIPVTHTDIPLSTLSSGDTYQLNALPQVDMTSLDKFCVNDLVLELS